MADPSTLTGNEQELESLKERLARQRARFARETSLHQYLAEALKQLSQGWNSAIQRQHINRATAVLAANGWLVIDVSMVRSQEERTGADIVVTHILGDRSKWIGLQLKSMNRDVRNCRRRTSPRDVNLSRIQFRCLRGGILPGILYGELDPDNIMMEDTIILYDADTFF